MTKTTYVMRNGRLVEKASPAAEVIGLDTPHENYWPAFEQRMNSFIAASYCATYVPRRMPNTPKQAVAMLDAEFAGMLDSPSVRAFWNARTAEYASFLASPECEGDSVARLPLGAAI